MASPLRRIRQGLIDLFIFTVDVDTSPAEAQLSPALYALFQRMTRSEQYHSLRVYHKLVDVGNTHPDVLTAALLHDVGKSRYGLNLFERSLVVLAGAVMPNRARTWGQGDPVGWRRAFVIKAQHPLWSAEDMAESGASPLAVEIARRHQDQLPLNETSEAARLIRQLQAVDDAE